MALFVFFANRRMTCTSAIAVFVLLNLQTDVYCHFCVFFFFGDGHVEDSDEYSAKDCKDDSDEDCEDDSDKDSQLYLLLLWVFLFTEIDLL